MRLEPLYRVTLHYLTYLPACAIAGEVRPDAAADRTEIVRDVAELVRS